MKNPVYSLFMVALVLLSASFSFAAADEIRFVYEDYAPYAYQENGEAKGFHVDIIRVVCSRIGVTPIFLHRPWARAIEDVRTGVADGIISIFKNSEREKYLYYPDLGLSEEESVVFVKRDGPEVTTIQDLDGLKVGIIRGYFYGEGVREQLPSKIYEFLDGEMLLRMLGENRISAGLGIRNTGEYMLEKLDYEDQIVVALVLSKRQMYVGFSKEMGERGKRLVEDFNRELKKLKVIE
ncbi:MAG: transporter substrate-binding domain-containing protein [Pseudodesulfovibrio sp.]|nr:transporter substrate-binding domain-containing protein [Pseudodesulfovibrio sp.]